MKLPISIEERNGRYLLPWCKYLLLAFISGFFLLATSKQLNNLFYVALCLPALFMLASHKKRLARHSRFFVPFFLLAGWMILTGLAMADPVSDAWGDLKPLVYVFLLAVVVFLVSEEYPDFLVLMCWTILVVATVSGVYRIYDFYSPNWVLTRVLMGSGVLSTYLWIGAAYGLAALIAVITYLREEQVIRQAAALLLGVIPFVVMLLAQARGPYVAFALAVAYSVITFRNRRAFILAAVGAFAIVFSLIYFPYVLEGSRLLQGGDSLRFAIWGNALEAIAGSPVVGHGVAHGTENTVGEFTLQHYHNVYLTLVFHAGIVGLLLFLPLVLPPLLAKSTPRVLLLKPILIFGMVYMVFNANRLFTSPRELWLIFWVPLLLLWAGLPKKSPGKRADE